MTRHRRSSAAAAAVLACVTAGPVAAESVRIVNGPNDFGTGWMFLDQDGCHVVTAGHVVAKDGRLLKLVVRDGRGREWTPGPPEVVSTDLDIAVVPIPSAADPSVCGAPGRSRLGAAGVAERARTLVGARIERAGHGEIVPVPVALAGTRMDERRGAVFAVKPREASFDVAQGWSGSPVTDAQGLIGIVIEAEPGSGSAMAVRADAIADLLSRARRGEDASAAKAPVVEKRAAATAAPAASGMPATQALDVTVRAGETVDPAQGPSELVAATGAGWVVRPKGGLIAFDVASKRERTFEHVTLTTTTPGRIADLEVAVEVAGGGEEKAVLPIRTCRVGAEATVLDCGFLAQTRKSLRITLRIRGGEPIGLGKLVVK